ncbi:cation:proton antiporter domain-containing protein [Brachybacterium huguangmaarense]
MRTAAPLILVLAGIAVILVLISSLGLGLVFSLLVPDLGFVWGAALGAVLSPTDAVATSIIKGKGVPDRVVTILEGESLFNDATSLVILSTAIGTMWVRSRLRSAEAGTVLSFTVPFIASVPTEMLGASGLVAAVVAGLITGYRGPRALPAQHRLTSSDTWPSMQMVLEGFVFLTMGLQFRAVLRGLHEDGVGIGVGIGLAVVLAVRAAWMVPQLWYVASRARRGHDMQPRIERMQQRLETSRRLTEQQLEGWEKVQERLEGIESPTHQQLSAAWRSVLQEMADQGDDLALRRLEMHEKTVALQETDPIERGDSEAWRRRYEHLASGLENGDTTDGDATDGDANADSDGDGGVMATVGAGGARLSRVRGDAKTRPPPLPPARGAGPTVEGRCTRSP